MASNYCNYHSDDPKLSTTKCFRSGLGDAPFCPFFVFPVSLKVGYIIGSSQQPLPADLMADLDNEMVPAINSAATRYRRGPLVMELLFRILKLF